MGLLGVCLSLGLRNPQENCGSSLRVSPKVIRLAGFSRKGPECLSLPGRAEAIESRETGYGV